MKHATHRLPGALVPEAAALAAAAPRPAAALRAEEAAAAAAERETAAVAAAAAEGVALELAAAARRIALVAAMGGLAAERAVAERSMVDAGGGMAARGTAAVVVKVGTAIASAADRRPIASLSPNRIKVARTPLLRKAALLRVPKRLLNWSLPRVAARRRVAVQRARQRRRQPWKLPNAHMQTQKKNWLR